MSVYIYQPDALDRMALVEGTSWKEHQNGDPDGPYSFNGFLTFWREWANYAQSEGIDIADDVFSLEVENNTAIYGAGGWHRYAVRSDGEIIFLAHFCENPQRYRPLVEKAGFRIRGLWKGTP